MRWEVADGRRLRRQREARGLTQQELADRVGVTRTWYRLVESGSGTPSLPLLTKLARVLRVTVRTLARTLAPGPSRRRQRRTRSLIPIPRLFATDARAALAQLDVDEQRLRAARVLLVDDGFLVTIGDGALSA